MEAHNCIKEILLKHDSLCISLEELLFLYNALTYFFDTVNELYFKKSVISQTRAVQVAACCRRTYSDITVNFQSVFRIYSKDRRNNKVFTLESSQ